MSRNEYLVPLLTALHDLVAWLQSKNIPGIIIGGVAASILGRPRLTRDVDAVVLLDDNVLGKFLSVVAQFGFIPRHPDVLAFAKKNRVLLVHHKMSGIDVDISLGVLPFEEEAINRAVWTDIGGVKVPLPTPEDLIIMKAVAHRQRDLSDIESILDAHPNLDLKRIRKWVSEFSLALEMPEILNDLENILKQQQRQNKQGTNHKSD